MKAMIRPRRVWMVILIAILILAAPLLLWPTPQAQAHPLGNFTINRYTRIELSPDTITLHYVLDMAEIPAFQERGTIDSDGDGTLSVTERASYTRTQSEMLREGLLLTVNGEPVQLGATKSDLSFPPGQGGLDTQRLVADFTASMPEGWEQAAQHVEFRDENYRERLGWREVVVRPLAGVQVLNSTTSAEDISDELRAYPSDGISNPLSVDSATFSFEPGGPSVAAVGGETSRPVDEASEEARAVKGNPDAALARYANLIAKDQLTVGVVVVALLAAMGFGAIHALSPGHGKTIVAAYLVGSRGTARQALLLGLTVTATHTSSVYALGFVTLYLSGHVLPEQLYPWLSIAAGGLILVMGLSLFVGRLRSAGLVGEAFAWLKVRLGAAAPTRRAEFALTGPGLEGMAMPRSATGFGELSHQFETGSGAHEASPTHRHGFGSSHSHTAAGPDGQPVTWRNLVGLGIFGGLLPCPSAIVVMLSAIALHRVAFGLVLILAFSFGLAGVLTGIGFVLVYAGKISKRLPILKRLLARAGSAGGVTSFAVRAFPVGSAAAVVAAGLVVTLRGLAQGGFL